MFWLWGDLTRSSPRTAILVTSNLTTFQNGDGGNEQVRQISIFLILHEISREMGSLENHEFSASKSDVISHISNTKDVVCVFSFLPTNVNKHLF